MFGLSSAGVNQGSPLEGNDATLTYTRCGFSQFSLNICPVTHIFICDYINWVLQGCQIKKCYLEDSKMLFLARLFSAPRTTLLAVSKHGPERCLGRRKMWEEKEGNKRGHNFGEIRGEKRLGMDGGR